MRRDGGEPSSCREGGIVAVLVQIAATLLTGVLVRGACEMYDIHRDAPVLIIIAMWAMWKVLGPTPVYER